MTDASSPSPVVVERTVTYIVHYKYPACFDDGGWGHDTYWVDCSSGVDADSDDAARRATFEVREFREREHCYHGRSAFPVRIVRTTREVTGDGFSRVTEADVSLPPIERCPCGERYVAVLGGSACHALTEIEQTAGTGAATGRSGQ